MRKLLLLAATVIAISSLNGQGFYGTPNGDCESWSSATSLNTWSLKGGSTNRIDHAVNGAYGAEVKNNAAAAGKIENAFGFTKRVTRARFEYKFAPATGSTDKYRISIYLTRATSNGRETIAAIVKEGENVDATWQVFDFPFTYFNSNVPDSAWITVESSINANYNQNTALWVDNFALQAPAGVQNSDNNIETNVYPNPSSDKTTLSYSTSKSSTVALKIFDVTGKEVMTIPTEKVEKGSHQINIETSNLKPGIYYFQINVDGVNKTGRFSVSR